MSFLYITELLEIIFEICVKFLLYLCRDCCNVKKCILFKLLFATHKYSTVIKKGGAGVWLSTMVSTTKKQWKKPAVCLSAEMHLESRRQSSFTTDCWVPLSGCRPQRTGSRDAFQKLLKSREPNRGFLVRLRGTQVANFRYVQLYYRGFERKGGGIRIITFRVKYRLQSK